MASAHLSRTSDLLKENLNRCHIKNGLFDSGKLWNIKKNILSEISSKWDSTFNDNNSLREQSDDTDGGNCSTQTTTATTTSMVSNHSNCSSIKRKSKIRSVYGQPEVALNNQFNSIHQQNYWRSLDSLDTCDSGQGFGSNSTSLSDLRLTTSEHHKGSESTNAFVSDIGTSVESSDNELEPYKRCPSSISTSSGCSISSQDDELDREAKLFMRQFVNKIFVNSTSISLEEKAKFGFYSRSQTGRLWFARFITKERNENKCVRESTFYSLAQYFAIILFECAEADDFTPAKILMNMCFTYFHNQHSNRSWRPSDYSNQIKLDQNVCKQYLYTVLRDQPIWRSLRFWNAAFFDAVQCERANFFENDNSSVMTKQRMLDDLQFQANVTFGQLGTFTYNMHSFGLPKMLCLEFLQKQSTIANLMPEQSKLLKDNIDQLYQCSN